MTTRFDIGENVYLEAKIYRIDIDKKGTVSYHIRLAGDGTVLWADENTLHKTPENNLKCIKIPENNELEWIKEEGK